jgi:hypothetical protein
MRILENVPVELEGISGRITRHEPEEITVQNEGCGGHDEDVGHDQDDAGAQRKMLNRD